MVVCQGVTPSRCPSIISVHACGSDIIAFPTVFHIVNYVVKQRQLSSLSSLAQNRVGRMCDATIY